MRMKGKLIRWDAAKAFGFITPNGGGKDVFVHKKAFANRGRQPQIDDVITFSISQDPQGRYCAVKATFAGEKIKAQTKNGISKFSIYLAIIFLGAIVAAALLKQLPQNLVIGYLILSLLTFFIYASDKAKAKRGDWRTPESTLHFLALIGGWPGAALAQQLLRHKSKKQPFRAIFWLSVLINIVALGWLTKQQQLLTLFNY